MVLKKKHSTNTKNRQFPGLSGFLMASFMAYHLSHGGGSWELCQWFCAMIFLLREGWAIIPCHSNIFWPKCVLNLVDKKSERPSYSWNLCTDFGADIFTMWPDDFRRFPQILGKWFEFLTLILCWSTYLAWVPQFLNHSSLGFFVGVFGWVTHVFFHEKSWGGHLIFSSCLW